MTRSGHLPVSDGHEIHFEQHGDPRRSCFLCVHGGPGGGIRDDERALVTENSGHSVLFDQRGAGGSRYADLYAGNTTGALIEDMERLRAHLGIDQWVLVGGSWGSTLSLAYTLAHPERVTGMILWGLFLCRWQELTWFYDGGAAHLYPDEYARYRAASGAGPGESPLDAYHRLLNDPEPETAKTAAAAWARWEAVNSFLEPTEDKIAALTRPEQALPMARLETHYFVNGAFFETDGWLLREAARIADIPALLIQGRYDTICPPITAWELHRALPRSRLRMIPNAAHDSSEPGLREALAHALRICAEV